MKIHNVAQGSVEWALLRCAIPTASEFDNLVTPHGAIRKGQMPQSYLYKKLAEWWQGGPLPQFNSLDMEFGHILEEKAIPWCEMEFGEPVQRVGFITTDDGMIGCSPDGLIGEGESLDKDYGIEIKCPQIDTHTGYLLEGEVPEEYRAQVYGSMYVTGFARWKFVSYRRRMPALVVEVKHDDKWGGSIAEALNLFLEKFEAGKKRLEEINGGPRPQPVKLTRESEPQQHPFDVIP